MKRKRAESNDPKAEAMIQSLANGVAKHRAEQLADIELWLQTLPEGLPCRAEESMLTWLGAKTFDDGASGEPHRNESGYQRSMREFIDRNLLNFRIEAGCLQAVLFGRTASEFSLYVDAHPPSAECIALLLLDHEDLTRSETASAAASRKNEAARNYVASEWRNRSDRGQSKASFGRVQTALVRRLFDVQVTADRIARYWIPKD